ncbi:MAG TPA: nitrilase-related carbon-nitrogen hydrolase, partial [Sphingomonas sp.]|nr:nitrilase-related carbon-nitrogen hydrolase [Sphingomonas sp.]
MTKHRFYSIHSHGLVRVGACTPRATVGDIAANTASHVALARQGDEAGADLLVFTELGITGYALDDLHLQDAVLRATRQGLADLVAASARLRPVLVVGAALERNGRLYNCAVVIARGRVLGVVPKTFLPNYREYYEKRWFASGLGLSGEIELAGQTAPFGPDLIFAADDLPDFVFHAEICEDFWAPIPPSTYGALAGAAILCNLSASNVTIGKARQRALLCAAQSERAVAAYVFSASGPGESTTDLAWDGQSLIHELGELLAASGRFDLEDELILADIDVARIRQERMRVGTFNDSAAALGHPETEFRRIAFRHEPGFDDTGLHRKIRRYPFVPNTPEKLDEDCYEAFNIQVEGLRKRIESTGS